MTYLTTWICRFCGVQRTALRLNGAGKIPVAEVDRLIEARGIAPEVAQRAALAKAVGFNDWTSPTVAAGERMHGGPACAFIVRMLLNGATITRHKAS